MKLELLVIVNKNVTVNMFLNFVHTARHAMEISFARKLKANKELERSRNKVVVGEPAAGNLNLDLLSYKIIQ